jgi:hypothetical protein
MSLRVYNIEVWDSLVSEMLDTRYGGTLWENNLDDMLAFMLKHMENEPWLQGEKIRNLTKSLDAMREDHETLKRSVFAKAVKRLLAVEKELDALKAEHVELLQRLEERQPK